MAGREIRTAATPTLLGIPRELRDQILGQLNTVVHPDRHCGTLPTIPNQALWLTCKQLYEERGDYDKAVHRYWSAEDDYTDTFAQEHRFAVMYGDQLEGYHYACFAMSQHDEKLAVSLETRARRGCHDKHGCVAYFDNLGKSATCFSFTNTSSLEERLQPATYITALIKSLYQLRRHVPRRHVIVAKTRCDRLEAVLAELLAIPQSW